MRAIGSPFSEEKIPPPNESTKLRLYEHAKINKIGFLYLHSLHDIGALGSLRRKYEQELRRERLFKETLVNVFRNLNDVGIYCVAFKTLLPFPCNLNDVDLLLLEKGTTKEELVRLLRRRGYVDYCGSPASISVHDSRDGMHLDNQQKDPYDLDLYQEIAINRFKYLDKEKLRAFTIKLQVEGQEIFSFTPEVDLAIQIAHSVMDWQLFTLMHYFSILFNLHSFKLDQLKAFARLVRDNRIMNATRNAVLISANLHNSTFGSVPKPISQLLDTLRVKFEPQGASASALEVPIKYSLKFIMNMLMEKLSDGASARSVPTQAISLLHPRTANYLVRHLTLRRRRMTY